MHETFDPSLKAQVTEDDAGRVRAIRHPDEFAESDQDNPLEAAIDYVRQVAGVFDVGEEQLDNIHVQATHLDPAEQGVEYLAKVGEVDGHEGEVLRQGSRARSVEDHDLVCA